MIRFKPQFADGDFVFLNQLPKTEIPAERMASEEYFKLMLQRIRPYWDLSITPESLQISKTVLKRSL